MTNLDIIIGFLLKLKKQTYNWDDFLKMIISHQHRFIFIKTEKTAGTSIELELNKILGAEDIATPIYPKEEGHKPMNYKRGIYGIFGLNFYNHMPAKLVRAYIGSKVFNSYFKFTVEREPVDKCISHYFWIKNSLNKYKNITWDEYIKLQNFPVCLNKYTDKNGKLIVDKIVRYENLNSDLADIAQKLGFKFELKARAKSKIRKSLDVSTRQKEIIYENFLASNKYTGY